MIARTLTAWLCAICIAMLLGGAIHLDDLGPSDAQAEWDQSAAMQDAIKTEAEKARFSRAAAEMCGNAWWTVDVDGVVHCMGRQPRGHGVKLVRMDWPAEVKP